MAIGLVRETGYVSFFIYPHPRFDTDADGEMDKEEFLDFVYVSNLEQARGFLKAADADGSGKLSKDELAAAFAQVSRNNNNNNSNNNNNNNNNNKNSNNNNDRQ